MHAVVTQVDVQVVPFGPEGGESRWDLFSGPDLYYEVYDPDGACLCTSGVVNDVRPRDLPITMDAAFSVETPGRHVLQLLDADLIEDEVVGRVGFAPDRIWEEGPASASTRTVCLRDETVTLRLVLEYTEKES